MPRSKKKRATLAAEKVLRQAIDEETAAVRAELAEANLRIKAMQAAFASIAAAAMSAQGEVVAGPPQEKRVLPPELMAPPTHDFVPMDDPVDLAGEDNMGSGRWV